MLPLSRLGRVLNRLKRRQIACCTTKVLGGLSHCVVPYKLHSRSMADSTAEIQLNRLAKEKSPYLLQHANNPVDWFPWGEEAFEKSRAENKPIFLSVGYSTCHWCHVMEKESFMSDDVAQILNTSFVPVKVDREERPDVDKVYMTFIQVTSGGGGWPMSVWLTPDLKPFLGGTYFPLEDRHGRPGFKTVLTSIAKQWETNKDKIHLQGNAIIEAIERHMAKAHSGFKVPDENCYEKLYEDLSSQYDLEFGGFSTSPKFPQPCIFNFLLRFHCLDPKSSASLHALNMTKRTLDFMEKGGIHDHVGQGFHRYSTDQTWHVPHFEKMLYDQSQLALVYLDAFQLTRDKKYAETAKDILLYVMRDLSHKSGGFFSAEDADSLPTHDATDKKEGAFFVWSEDEIRNHLSEPVKENCKTTLADVFIKHYSVSKNGNVRPHQDPHGDLKCKNILIVRGTMEDTANAFNLNLTDTTEALSKGREILFEERRKRPSPHLDDKMVTAWNGLMISAFARASQVLGEDVYLKRALKAANFVRTHLFEETTGKLFRSCYQGEDGEVTQITPPVYGFSEDYAYVIKSLVDLYEASFDEQWLIWAESLQQKQDELFWDNTGGGYFQTEKSQSNLVLRLKEDMDAAEPSASSVSVHNLLRLSGLLESKRLREKAEWILSAYEGHLSKIPLALPEMMGGLLIQQMTNKQIIIVGDPEGDDTRKLLQCVHYNFMPNKVLILHDGNSESYLASKVSVLHSLTRVKGQATAYVCENYTCDLPVSDPENFFKVLSGSSAVW